jgi:hypothetical protein
VLEHDARALPTKAWRTFVTPAGKAAPLRMNSAAIGRDTWSSKPRRSRCENTPEEDAMGANGNDPAQMFQQIMQQMTQGQGGAPDAFDFKAVTEPAALEPYMQITIYDHMISSYSASTGGGDVLGGARGGGYNDMTMDDTTGNERAGAVDHTGWIDLVSVAQPQFNSEGVTDLLI